MEPFYFDKFEGADLKYDNFFASLSFEICLK